jgi:hypothetical protein
MTIPNRAGETSERMLQNTDRELTGDELARVSGGTSKGSAHPHPSGLNYLVFNFKLVAV